MTPDAVAAVDIDFPYDLRRALPTHGTATDPTFRHRPDSTSFTGRTPAGPMAARVRKAEGTLVVEAWGAGADWLVARADAIAAHHDDPRRIRFDHTRLDETNRRHPGVRHAATGLIVDALLARVLGQRVLAAEAARSWKTLCRELGGPAPGPLDLLLPPDHGKVAETPTWWFHQHGVDRGRATTLTAVARRSDRLAEVVDLSLPQAYGRLRAMPGLGPWTVNGAVRTALGDPDAIVVGDYWISHAVCSYFTGRSRGSDDEMLRLVERWEGQRGRVERLVHLSGHRVQRFGPGRPTPRIARL